MTSNQSRRHDTVVLLMPQVTNYSDAPTNSASADWNWTSPTRPDRPVVVPVLSSGFQFTIVVVLSFLVVAGTLLNLVTVVTHLQRRLTALRVNILAVNLACCDLLRSTVPAPLLLFSILSTHWPSGLLGCRWYLTLSILFGTASLNTVTAIAIDRQVRLLICLRYALTLASA